MSIFANETEGQGAVMGPGVVTEGNDGFNAFGKPVPSHRKQAAMDHLKEMGVSSAQAFDISSRMAEAIARDRPHDAMQIGYDAVDVTGVYRVLAVLCTG